MIRRAYVAKQQPWDGRWAVWDSAQWSWPLRRPDGSVLPTFPTEAEATAEAERLAQTVGAAS